MFRLINICTCLSITNYVQSNIDPSRTQFDAELRQRKSHTDQKGQRDATSRSESRYTSNQSTTTLI